MEELHESFLAAEGAAGTEQAGRSGKHKNCLNCGTELKGAYCHECGQKDLPQRQTTGELLSNFVSSFSNYEGKFLLTVKYLILRPGSLALDYNSGKRERYFHPVRMYAFISFVFFLIFFSLPEEKEEEEKEDPVEMTDEDRREHAKDRKEAAERLAAMGVDTSFLALDSLANPVDSLDKIRNPGGRKKKSNFTLTNTEYETQEAYDSAQAALPEDKRDNWLERRLNHRSIELNQRYGNDDDDSDFGKDFWEAATEQFPKVLFFLLPVFALLLKLFYVRRNYFYSEHLVFSIYYYNFFYFAGSIMMLVGLVDALDWLTVVIGWGIYLYLLFSMKRMYKQGWGKTIVKFLLFSFAFSFCLGLAFMINFAVILMIL